MFAQHAASLRLSTSGALLGLPFTLAALLLTSSACEAPLASNSGGSTAGSPAGSATGGNTGGSVASGGQSSGASSQGAAGSAPNAAAGASTAGAATGGAGTGGGATGGSTSTGGTATGDASAELFDPAKFPRFDLELSAAAVQALKAVKSTDDPAQDTYVEANFTYDRDGAAESVAKVGVRLKGTGSFQPFDKKPAFKIKFDELTKDQRFRGLARLTLNNNYDDASFLAERVAYAVYRAAKVPAPRCNSARVYVNGEFYGVYTNIETEDKHFLKHWFTNNGGNLFEKDGYGDFRASDAADFQLETNETANDRSDLTALLNAVDAATKPETFAADLEPHLDMAAFVKLAAVEGAVNQWDSYSFAVWWPHNFRLYNDPANKKFYLIPWGHDLSMKHSPFKDRTYIDPFELTHQNDDQNAPVAAGILFQRCLASAGCRATYVAALRSVLEVWRSIKPEALAKTYYDQIKDQVHADTRKATFDGALTSGAFDTAAQSLITLAQGRAASLEQALVGK